MIKATLKFRSYTKSEIEEAPHGKDTIEFQIRCGQVAKTGMITKEAFKFNISDIKFDISDFMGKVVSNINFEALDFLNDIKTLVSSEDGLYTCDWKNVPKMTQKDFKSWCETYKQQHWQGMWEKGWYNYSHEYIAFVIDQKLTEVRGN